MRCLDRWLGLSLTAVVVVGCAPVGESDVRRQHVEESLKSGIMPSDVPGYPLADRMVALGAPGITVAVIDDFEIDWARAYGAADVTSGRKLTTETRHNVGSISKTVCALTAMRLVEMGKLSLDEPINDYLDSWHIPENEFTRDNPVTLRHLLSHSAGTTLHGFPGYRPDATLPSMMEVLDGVDPANTPPVRVNRLPGQGFRYSGGGTTVVQQAIMDVTGKPFEDAARELVLEPLGMRHSTYTQPVHGVDIGERAVGRAGNPSFEGTEVFVAQGAAGLWSTPSDLARFMIEIMRAYRGDDGTIITQETAREMLTVVTDGVGLGFFLGDHDGAVSFDHGGSNTGFHAHVWGLPSTGQGAVTIVNSDSGSELQEETLRAISEIYQWPEGAWDAESVETSELSREAAAAITGRYQFGENDVITITTDGPRVTYRECFWRGRVSGLLPLANGHFQLVTSNATFGVHPEFLFETGAGGDVTAMRLVGSDYVMPRLDDDTLRPLEHIEAGQIDLALARWDEQPDLDLGLMRFSSQQFWMRFDDQREAGVKMRAYVAKRFPLDEGAQNMLADAYAAIGEATLAQEIRDLYSTRAAALEGVSRQLDAGQIDPALAAFDGIAAEIASPDAYRWLLDVAEQMKDSEPGQAVVVATHAHAHLPDSASAHATLAQTLWAKGDRPAAIDMMSRAIAASPAVEELVIARMWVRDRWNGETTTMSVDEMEQYLGDYGQRHIVVHEGKLSYFRGTGAPRELVPVDEHQFMMRSEDYFKMEFEMDAEGRARKIIGYYSDGHRDESPRDGAETASG